jgi:hypothetical protein
LVLVKFIFIIRNNKKGTKLNSTIKIFHHLTNVRDDELEQSWNNFNHVLKLDVYHSHTINSEKQLPVLPISGEGRGKLLDRLNLFYSGRKVDFPGQSVSGRFSRILKASQLCPT